MVVLYGPNNLGKSTQLELLEKHWREVLGRPYQRIKYPVYDLEPTGPKINSVLRQGVSMTEVDLQWWFARNRRDYEPALRATLAGGVDVLAEDYVGTGIAWGTFRGVPRVVLDNYNDGLLIPDVEILLDGERFSSGIERGHRNEDCDGWEDSREIHRQLAAECGWPVVNANRSPELVHRDIIDIVLNTRAR